MIELKMPITGETTGQTIVRQEANIQSLKKVIDSSGQPWIPASWTKYFVAALGLCTALIAAQQLSELPSVLLPAMSWVKLVAIVCTGALGSSAVLRTLSKVAMVLVVAGSLFLAAPAAAQVTWQVGPTLPLMLIEPTATHPVSVAPGAGVQLSLSMQQLQQTILGRNWDMLDLDAIVFGSFVSASNGEEFGALSVAGAACTMSNLICVGIGHHVLATSGQSTGGWFGLLALSFNVAVMPKPLPMVKWGENTLERANTIYF